MEVLTPGLIRDTLPSNVRSWYASTFSATAWPLLIHGAIFSGISAITLSGSSRTTAITGIWALTSSPRFTSRRSTKPSKGARISVSRSWRPASFMLASEPWMLARRLRAFWRAASYSPLRLQRRPGVVERLLRDQRPLEQLAGAVERLLRLEQVGVGALRVRRLLDLGQVLRVGRAELGQVAGQRRLLLIEGVLRLLAIELNERLDRRSRDRPGPRESC